jgi:hypothetical protein
VRSDFPLQAWYRVQQQTNKRPRNGLKQPLRPAQPVSELPRKLGAPHDVAEVLVPTKVTDTIGDQVFETPDPQASAINAGNQLIAIADFRPLPAFRLARPADDCGSIADLPDNASGCFHGPIS